MISKRSREGYLLIDNRNSPGVPAEQMRTTGLPSDAGRGLFESATVTCSHCHRIVVLNPDRTRERAYCSQCDYYLCDACGAARAHTGDCRPLNQWFDEMQARVARIEYNESWILSNVKG